MANKGMQALHERQAKLLTRLLDTASKSMDMLEAIREEELSEDPEERAVQLMQRAETIKLVQATSSAALLSTVNQFLKNNDVTAQNDDTEELSETKRILDKKVKKFSIADIPVEDMQ